MAKSKARLAFEERMSDPSPFGFDEETPAEKKKSAKKTLRKTKRRKVRRTASR